MILFCLCLPAGVQQLAVEATYINQAFSQQVLASVGDRVQLEQAASFAAAEGEELAPVGYRYRRWTVAEGLDLVVRCEVDAVAKVRGVAWRV